MTTKPTRVRACVSSYGAHNLKANRTVEARRHIIRAYNSSKSRSSWANERTACYGYTEINRRKYARGKTHVNVPYKIRMRTAASVLHIPHTL